MALETNSGKIYELINSQLMDHCGEALYPGDERRIFGEGLALVFSSLFGRVNDRASQLRLPGATGEDLDNIGAMLRVERLKPAPAVTTMRFSLSDVQGGNIIIPEGTRVTADGVVYWATTNVSVIQAGSSWVDVPVQCQTPGAAHNGYAAKSINVLVDLIPFVADVYNTTATYGGDDGEPYTEDGDNRYRERLHLAPASLAPGTESGYIYYAKSADADIIDVQVLCPENLPNTVNIFALMAGGVSPDESVLRKIEDAIETNNARIMTDKVQAFAPSIREYTINATYSCRPEDEDAVVAAIEGEGGVIDQYIQWQSAKLGRMILPDELIRMMYAAGAVTVNVTSPTALSPAKYMVARISGEPVITHTTMEVL